MTHAAYGEDPGDREFFEGHDGDAHEGKVRPEVKIPNWWRVRDSLSLSEAQMSGLGRIVASAISGEESMGQPGNAITSESMQAVAGEISQQLSALLHRSINTYWSRFFTRNKPSGRYRDNLIIMFWPNLTFEGKLISFHLDRLSGVNEVPGEGETVVEL